MLIIQMWYQYAKTAAEEAATIFLTEINIDYIVINPTATIGPLLQPELNESSAFIFRLIKGFQLVTDLPMLQTQFFFC
jgi:nucleoside-diphosphate-sugar epimerase